MKNTAIEWQTEANRRDEIKKLDHSVLVIKDETVQLQSHFAQSSDAVPFLDTIEGLAPQVGAKAEVVSVSITENNTNLVVGMKASGTFASLYKFLTLLENSPYGLDFTSMEIQKDTTAGASSNWNATFTMKLLTFIK